MSKTDSFFPSIGTVADQTDQLPENDTLPENPVVAGKDEVADGDDDRPVHEITSLCMQCEEQGTTRMLLTSIPYFREVIVMSFRCDHCGFNNNEIQSAGMIREQGSMHTAHVLIRGDLDRQVVKSEHCTVSIPEMELTIPPGRGQLTTVEGLLRDVKNDLSFGQPLRRVQDPPTYDKIQAIIDKVSLIVADEDNDVVGEVKAYESKDAPVPISFTLKLDDPAGNSFVEFLGSMADPKWNMRLYNRTKEQNVTMGLLPRDEANAENGAIVQTTGATVDEMVEKAMVGGLEGDGEEVYIFPGVCSSCGADLNTLMKKVVIPYFKDIFIMSTNCERCGYRDNEVKSGGAISDKGKKITLKVEDAEDLSRDILKSETCGLSIPEIDLVLHAGTLGGRFTTVEGILEQVYEELSEKVITGDSAADPEDRRKFEAFLANLKAVKSAETPFTLILDDPLANSYLQSLYAPDPDPNMEIELYDRTFEQNDDLGLNDMVLEGYEGDPNLEAQDGSKT